MNRHALTESELAARLAELPGWEHLGGQIVKSYEFGSYASGVMFAAGVGQLADTLDHHPDLFIGYQKVRVGMNTPDVGGITDFDLTLAARIERLSTGE